MEMSLFYFLGNDEGTEISIPFVKYFFLNHNATFTKEMSTGTSTNGPINVAIVSLELMPNIANSEPLRASIASLSEHSKMKKPKPTASFLLSLALVFVDSGFVWNTGKIFTCDERYNEDLKTD
jgi:hypothetical protein